jgi:uncharacterized coiled-coil protein SlyX
LVDPIEVVRQIEADAGLRAHLRAVLLGDEVLHLPAQVTENTRAIGALTEQVSHLAARMGELTEQVSRLTVRMDELTARVDQLTVRMDELTVRVDQLTEQVSRLTEQVGRLTGQMSDVRGTLMEREAIEKFGLVLDEVGVAYHSYEATDGLRYTDDETRFGKIARRQPFTKDELSRLKRTDVVALVRKRDGSTLTAVAEVSATVGADDVRRAATSARLLRFRGLEVLPLAVGDEAASGVEELARTEGVELVVGWR